MIEKKSFSTAKKQETAILVSVHTSKLSAEIAREHLDELAFLASTAGVKEMGRFTQKLDRPDSKTYVGKGKLEDIVNAATALEVDMVIVDDDLSPAQARNIEYALPKVKILDRSLLILEIFSIRAQTAQAKLQVELAQYQYLYPRLTRLWTHLSRQKGGIGMRGPGESELETDRRIVKDRIAFLKEKLKGIEKQSFVRRQGRERLVRLALVGYTNVGKSTIMNLLTKSEVLAENKLFATVDSTVRKVVFDDVPFLLSDTVGFIRKLPTHLIESFKSTLAEVAEADILLHIVDASHPFFEQQIEVVNGILKDMGLSETPMIYVFNKIDVVEKRTLAFQNPEDEEANPPKGEFIEGEWVEEIDELASPAQNPITLADLKQLYANNGSTEAVFISATEKKNIQQLREVIFGKVLKKHLTIYPNFLKTTVFSENSIRIIDSTLSSQNEEAESSN